MKRLLPLLALLAAGCARIAMPPGLPPDREAPLARVVEPAPGSTGLPARPVVEIQFNEYMDRASVGRALIFNPRWDGRLESDWSGRTLRLRPDRDLPAGRTWTLELGSAARDLAGNGLDTPLLVPFSTGTALDTLQLVLRATEAVGRGRDGVEFWLWPVQERPQRRFGQAPWRCTPDSTGMAVVKGLGAGPWFAMAVRDESKDGWWQPGLEEAALCSRLLATPDTMGRDPSLFRLSRLAGPDTLSLQSARFLNREQVQFNGWLDAPGLLDWTDSLRLSPAADSVRMALLELVDSRGKHLPLADLHKEEQGWVLGLERPADSLAHVLRFRFGGDSLVLSPPLSAFSGALVDAQALARQWNAGSRDILSRLPARHDAARLRLLKNGDTLAVAVRPVSATRFQIPADTQGGLLLVDRAFLTAGERVWPDSLIRLMVPAAPASKGAGADGGVQWKAPRLPQGSGWMLVLEGDEARRVLPFTREGLAEALRPGHWTFSLFQDRDGDGQWSPGLLGRRPAEPWLQLPASVDVLPGWIQSEVPVKLPEWLP